ncbi:MAG: hypothetical protein BGP06_21660 [Rhizobiales bacterium 65-9]|nr:PaaI family thioesterase [Hyphomicrobiales bacterium]OJY39576.1 MAG: hypothetical protein BGP06_21660 [Rhizobiales bacterium 65-9]
MLLSLQNLQAVIETCSFDKWMGLKAVELRDNSLSIRLPVRPEILGTPVIDRLHGGVVASLIDATACYLLIALYNKRVSTADMVIDYLRPAHGELVATSRLVKLGRTITVVSVDVHDAHGKHVSVGRLAISISQVSIGDEHQMATPAAA